VVDKEQKKFAKTANHRLKLKKKLEITKPESDSPKYLLK